MSVSPRFDCIPAKNLKPVDEDRYDHDFVRNAKFNRIPATTSFNCNQEETVTPEERDLKTTFILCACLGFFGAHHFYLRRYFYGFVYLFTFGIFGIGYILDILRIQALVTEANEKPKKKRIIKTLDVYVLWFPLGILGFHHFYMGNIGHGVLYFFTFGVCGIGWLMDFFRIPTMVTTHNLHDRTIERKSLVSAYLFALTPFGVLGAHHYYIHQWKWGLFYTLTCGVLGIGYLFDLIRLPIIVERANRRNQEDDTDNAYLDEAYLLWLTFGILGFHHFYLRSYPLALIYLCTFGIFGFGWLVDIVRVPSLVEEYNTFYDYDFEITELDSRPNSFREPSPKSFDDVFSGSRQDLSYIPSKRRRESLKSYYRGSFKLSNNNGQDSFNSSSNHRQKRVSSSSNHRQERVSSSSSHRQERINSSSNQSGDVLYTSNHRKESLQSIADIFTVSSLSQNPVSSTRNIEPDEDYDQVHSTAKENTKIRVNSSTAKTKDRANSHANSSMESQSDYDYVTSLLRRVKELDGDVNYSVLRENNGNVIHTTSSFIQQNERNVRHAGASVRKGQRSKVKFSDEVAISHENEESHVGHVNSSFINESDEDNNNLSATEQKKDSSHASPLFTMPSASTCKLMKSSTTPQIPPSSTAPKFKSKLCMEPDEDFDDLNSVDSYSNTSMVSEETESSNIPSEDNCAAKSSEHMLPVKAARVSVPNGRLPLKSLGVSPVRPNKSKNTQIHSRIISDDLDSIHGLPPLLIRVGNYRMKDDDVLL